MVRIRLKEHRVTGARLARLCPCRLCLCREEDWCFNGERLYRERAFVSGMRTEYCSRAPKRGVCDYDEKAEYAGMIAVNDAASPMTIHRKAEED